MLTVDDWREQLEYQARWVLNDLYPDVSESDVDIRPVLRDDSEPDLLVRVCGVDGFNAHLDGVRFANPPRGCTEAMTWDELVDFCNTVVG